MAIKIGELYVKDAGKIECSGSFPITAIAVKVRISGILPKDSAVLIYTPATADRPIRFNGPETTADVPVSGHEMYAQAILGCKQYQLDFLGWEDNI